MLFFFLSVYIPCKVWQSVKNLYFYIQTMPIHYTGLQSSLSQHHRKRAGLICRHHGQTANGWPAVWKSHMGQSIHPLQKCKYMAIFTFFCFVSNLNFQTHTCVTNIDIIDGHIF